jgi:hypothetical protein
LDQEPSKQSEALRSLAPMDLYLIAIGSLNDLVVRHDQRRRSRSSHRKRIGVLGPCDTQLSVRASPAMFAGTA